MELDNIDNSKIHRHEKCNIENKVIFMEDHIPIRPDRSLGMGMWSSMKITLHNYTKTGTKSEMSKDW